MLINGKSMRTIEVLDNFCLSIIDQNLLPYRLKYRKLNKTLKSGTHYHTNHTPLPALFAAREKSLAILNYLYFATIFQN